MITYQNNCDSKLQLFVLEGLYVNFTTFDHKLFKDHNRPRICLLLKFCQLIRQENLKFIEQKFCQLYRRSRVWTTRVRPASIFLTILMVKSYREIRCLVLVTMNLLNKFCKIDSVPLIKHQLKYYTPTHIGIEISATN